MQGLISLIVGGALLTGAAGGAHLHADLTDSQQQELNDARVQSVNILTDAEKEFAATLEGKTGRELTTEEREQLKDIKDKIHEETLENIEDETLKATLEEHKAEREAHRAEREENRANGEGFKGGKGMHRDM